MAIPLAYNLRNLMVRRTTTLMTALGIALTVSVLLAILSLVNGLRTTLQASGNPLHVIVMRKGSDSELNSSLTRSVFQELKFKAGVARGRGGEPLASLEIITVVNLASVDAPDGMNINVRGMLPAGIEMRDHIRIVEGRWFQTGKPELVVGKSIARRFPDARLARRIRFGRSQWEVVGVMDAGRSAQNSEMFCDVNQASAELQRPDVLSAALLRAADPVAAAALMQDLENDQRLNVMALSEKEYYANQTRSAAPIQFLGVFISLIMAVGSSFAAMNTMYAAVARRAREIGTLRVLGYSRASILTSFLVESLLLSALGGALGCLLVLPLNGITTAVGSNFAELAFDFQVSPRIMLIGLLFAAILGGVGGTFPARMAARKEILAALREV